MATFFIEQFGCRATQADAAAIERQLRDRGYAVSSDANSADVVVVNTCTVTSAADLQARQAIHAIHRDHPSAQIVVTGCYAQRSPEELAVLPGVSWVVGNLHKPEIPRLISEMAPVSQTRHAAGFVPASAIRSEQFSVHTVPVDSAPRDPGLARILTGDVQEQREFLFAAVEGGESGHTRPVLKIQDGCDKRCSYCVIPHVRGRSRSLAPDRAISELRKLAEGGAREVVLSGIDIGNYGRDLTPRTNLRDLLRRSLYETGIERLRVSSIEPIDVSEELIGVFAESGRMARHFHMPLQSGSDRILAAMHRWYRAEHYARRAELVRERLPDAAIGADVIAGFPGETEDDHRCTLALIETLPLTYVHVFSFSPRPGTPAAEMRDPVPAADISRRAGELRALGEEKKAAFHKTQLGRAARVLTLNRGGKGAFGAWTRAISGNYLDVRVSGEWATNQFVDIKIGGVSDNHLCGAVV
jgi:threonylcarbamoyladenosine tRNA methylthiotransferase MtaB